MSTVILFGVSIVILIAAAFLHYNKESESYAGLQSEVSELREAVNVIRKSDPKQIEEILSKLNRLEEQIKQPQASPSPQKVIVQFTPLNVHVDKSVVVSKAKPKPLLPRAGIK